MCGNKRNVNYLKKFTLEKLMAQFLISKNCGKITKIMKILVR